MTGKVSDNIQCNTCRQYFPRDKMPKSGEHKCPECLKIYRRNYRKKKRKEINLKDTDEYKYCESFGSAGVYL